MKIAVITPTIASKHLKQCIESVATQTYEDIVHYIVIDGKEHNEYVKDTIAPYKHIRTIHLEENIGHGGWNGHRVYAASPYLVDADAISFLDNDNWFQPNHIETMVKTLESKKLQWCYSLRNIHDEDGTFLMRDDCESLGKWEAWTGARHIDTQCYLVRKDTLLGVSHAWYEKWPADRQFYATLNKHRPSYDCSRQYTVNYRLGGNPISVKKEFFEEGNAKMKEKYPEEYPWNTNDEYITISW